MQEAIIKAKKAAAEEAVNYIESGMTIGLGTGSTAYWAIVKIGELVKQGLNIRAIATSAASEALAQRLHIPLVNFAGISHIDVDIDGADEIDEQLNLTKGGGGALLREKIIAAASKRMIVIADEAKKVRTLGAFGLPVEVVRFGWEMTLRKLEGTGSKPVLRKEGDYPFLTDNGNYIIDCAYGELPDPASLDALLHRIPGVVETGLFVQMAHTVIIGKADGTTTTLHHL